VYLDACFKEPYVLCMDHVSVSMCWTICSMYLFCCVDDLPYIQFMEHFLCLVYQFCCVSVSIVYQFCYLHTVSANLVYTCPRNLVHTVLFCPHRFCKFSSYRFQSVTIAGSTNYVHTSSAISFVCMLLQSAYRT
jgi:hypothetical protein